MAEMNDYFAASPKELISESLRDVLPSDEEIQGPDKDDCITVMLVAGFTDMPAVGFLIGVEVLPTFKLDVKVSLEEGYNFISGFIMASSRPTISSIIINYGEKITKIEGPYSISSTKIVETDSVTKTCVVAIDLIKISTEKK